MESDESIDLVDSEAVNAYGSVVAKEERKILVSITKKVKMLLLSFINFFLGSLSSLNRTRVSWSFLPIEKILRSKEWSRL